MALKNRRSYVHLYVSDTSSSLGVTGCSRTGSFSRIKLRQDSVLSDDIKSSVTLIELGMGYYSFSARASLMNYGVIQRIRIPISATWQTYSPVIYTQGGYLDVAVSSRLASGAVSVSANSDKTGYSITANSDKTGYRVSSIPAGFSVSVTSAARGVNFAVSANNDKTGYSIIANSDKTGYQVTVDPMSYSAVTRAQVNDKTGYVASVNLAMTAVTRSQVTDKSGYSISANSDKTGYSLATYVAPALFSDFYRDK